MSNPKTKKGNKPFFNGYLKMFLHDDDPERLVSRAEATQDWLTKRNRIFKKPRKFSIRFHIVDTDGHRRAHEVGDFTVKGGEKALSRAIYTLGLAIIDELKSKNIEVDSINSYAVVRA